MDDETKRAIGAINLELDWAVGLLKGELAELDPEQGHLEVMKRLRGRSPKAAEAVELALENIDLCGLDSTDPQVLRAVAGDYVFDLATGVFDHRSAVVVLNCGTPRYVGVSSGMEEDGQALEDALGALGDGWAIGSHSLEFYHSILTPLGQRSPLAGRALRGAYYTLLHHQDKPGYDEALAALSRSALREYQAISRARKNLTRACREALESFEAPVEDPCVT